MWEPDPAWQHLPGAGGPSTLGLWLAETEGRRWVVKRLGRPEDTDRMARDPSHAAYWRREAEVARAPAVVDGPGLVPPAFGRVEEDPEGITVWSEEAAGEPPSGLFVARALGRFAAARHDVPAWATRGLLESRLAMAEARGGWPTLARTPLADVSDRLWQRRGLWLARCAASASGRGHGDAVPGTSWPAAGRTWWPSTGSASASARWAATWATTRCRAARSSTCSPRPSPTARGCRWPTSWCRRGCTRVYTVLSRTEWALRQVAKGEGALLAKLRHPAVAPHVRALQRQFPQMEALV